MKYVLVLVVGRAVAKEELVALDGPQRQFLQEAPIRRAEMLARPLSGDLRGVIECALLVDSGGEAIVIASNVEFFRFERAHRVDDLIRLGAIPDKVAEADDAVEFLAADVTQHRAQRLRVRMEIADHKRPHEVLRARPRGN